jgi:quercetin dioxygenase-like cupin family protein
MPIERAADHPTFELGGNAITSLAAPARGSDETALFRIDLPAGGALPAHHHDHFDVFTVAAGSATRRARSSPATRWSFRRRPCIGSPPETMGRRSS